MEISKAMLKALIDSVPKGAYVLEPSAGYGILASTLIAQKHCKVDVVELNTMMIKCLKERNHFNEVLRGDFIELAKHKLCKREYDYVVAVPPYKDNIDCQHIMAMYECIRPGGHVYSFTLPYWVAGTYTNQIQFREWLNTKDFRLQFFEDKSYANCPKALLTVRKWQRF